MKFTNDQAFESLKSELTNKGRKTLRMSERTLKALTDNLVNKLADEEMGLPDFVETALDFLNPVNDNIGKDKSDFVKNWEKEHPTDTPPVDTPPTETKPNDNSELAALKAEIESLKQQNAEAAKKATIASKRKELVAKLKEKGVKDDEWVSNFLSEVNITEDLDVDAKADSWLKLYNKSAANGGSSVPPANPGGGSAADSFKKSIEAAAQLAKKERVVIEQK